MSINLDKDYNDYTKLSNWWKIVKNNFGTIESFVNETRRIADAAATPNDVETELASLVSQSPSMIAALEAFTDAFNSAGGEVRTAIQTLANNYARKQAGDGNIQSFNHTAVGNIAVGYLKDHVFPGNVKKSGFVMSNYEPSTNKTHILFVDWADGRIYVKDDLNTDWVDVLSNYDTMKATYDKVHLSIGAEPTLTASYHNNTVTNCTYDSCTWENLPYVSWSYSSTEPLLAHQYFSSTEMKVYFKALRDSEINKRVIYVVLPNGTTLSFKESDNTWIVDGDRYYITIPSQKMLVNSPSLAMYIKPSYDMVSGSSSRTYAHANNFEVQSGAIVKEKEIKLEVAD